MSIGADTIPIISSIRELGSGYRAWLVDIWGVMHNGVRSFAPAVEATTRFTSSAVSPANASLDAFHVAFFVAACLVLVAAASAFLIRDRDAANTIRRLAEVETSAAA